jgi:hypothetical protein
MLSSDRLPQAPIPHPVVIGKRAAKAKLANALAMLVPLAVVANERAKKTVEEEIQPRLSSLGTGGMNRKNRSGIAKVCLAVSSAVWSILASESFGQEPVEELPEEAEALQADSDLGSGLLSGPRWSPEPLIGDWFGARSWLADRGLTFGINLVDTYQGVVEGERGGARRPD